MKYILTALHKYNFCYNVIVKRLGDRAIKKHLIISALVSLALSGISVQAAMTPEANSLYQQACSAEYQQDYDTAVAKLTQAIQIAGDDALLYTKLAGVYSEMGEYEKALLIYAKVAEMRPSDAFIYISVGSIYENQGKYLEALESYNKALEIFPEYKYNYLNIANVQYQLRDYKSAIENYNKFLSTYTQHWEAREALANSYLSVKPSRPLTNTKICIQEMYQDLKITQITELLYLKLKIMKKQPICLKKLLKLILIIHQHIYHWLYLIRSLAKTNLHWRSMTLYSDNIPLCIL